MSSVMMLVIILMLFGHAHGKTSIVIGDATPESGGVRPLCVMDELYPNEESSVASPPHNGHMRPRTRAALPALR